MFANLFVPGMPRSGTTSMALWLDSHSDVVLSRPKEPGYFAQDLRMTTFEQSAAAYTGAFSGAGDARFRLDATPWYLYSQVAIGAIMEAVPSARFIVMVRNPADQVVSMHRHHLKVGYERERDVMRAVATSRPAGAGDFRHGLDYLGIARIGEQMERLLRIVPRSDVHVVDFDDLQADAAGECRSVLSWLGLPGIDPSSFGKHNAGMDVRSPLLQRLLLAGRRPSTPRLVRSAAFRLSKINLRRATDPAPDHVIQWLLRELEPDIQRLERALGRSFDHWRIPAVARQQVQPPVD